MDQQSEFRDFPHGSMQSAAFLDIESDSEMARGHTEFSANPLTGSEEQANQRAPFWSVGFFQNLFDIDTDQVLHRLKGAIMPVPKNFLQHHVNGKPDLYGPFWICTTLVFSIAISGNLASYLQAGAANEDYHWQYDFHAVTLSATAIYSYAWIVPLGLWGVIKWMVPEEHRLSFLDLICVYGYSLTIYIPVSILWVIQVSWLQWFLAILGASLSALVLVGSIWPAIIQIEARRYLVLGIILLLHISLAAGFMLYFFHAPHTVSKTQNDFKSASTVPLMNGNLNSTSQL